MKDEVYYKAMLARDPRFDGKFYVGVKTTGIYCRPICPAKPRRENVEFFSSAGAAERRGYRPCMRCRPECAPDSPAWNGKSAIVRRALSHLSQEEFFKFNENDFADRFGISARHLRRLFVDEVGLTPKQIASSIRLNFARRLISETKLTMMSIALNSGFSSLRRFNDAFKKRFSKPPNHFRRRKATTQDNLVELKLAYRPPISWDSILSYFRGHLVEGIESICGDAYQRYFVIDDHVGKLELRPVPNSSNLSLKIWAKNSSCLFPIVAKVRRMCDLDSDPVIVANAFEASKLLTLLYQRDPGLRLVRGWDPFERAICTILGQLVSLAQARELTKQLIMECGDTRHYLDHPSAPVDIKMFPSPEAIARSELASLKTTEARKNCLRELSKRVASGEINLNIPLASELRKKELLRIRGIGEWSAENIALRGLGDTDAFPATDLILKRALDKHRDLDLESMRPWRSYVAVYLWHNYASRLSKGQPSKISTGRSIKK